MGETRETDAGEARVAYTLKHVFRRLGRVSVELGVCMSSVGGRRFAGRLFRHTARTPVPAQVGRWDHFVDRGPRGSRSYAVYTPPGLRRGAPVPLVVVLHGCNQSGMDAALGTDVNAFADRAGFVVLYPEQSTADNLQRCWNWFEPRHQSRGFGEPAALARITEKVLRGGGAVTLDRNRVHVMGLSAGGAMAGILAATYPDVYASVGIHSAPQYGAARSPMTALMAMKSGGPDPKRQGRLAHSAMGPRSRVVPVIVVQGAADRTVWSGNGDRVVRQWLTTSALATGQEPGFDFALPDAITADRAPGGMSYSVRHWNDGAGRPVVSYWNVPDLGHAWSGGASAGSYTDPRGPSATEAMCDFFSQSSMDRGLAAAGRPGGSVDLRTTWAALVHKVTQVTQVTALGRRRRPQSAPERVTGLS
jgi:poly(hydroxyalkanoate) depolymerase family esterase